MSKHGQDFNEHCSYGEGFEDGRRYEREQIQSSEVEGLVEAFWRKCHGESVHKDGWIAIDGFNVEEAQDWLRIALTTHGAKERREGFNEGIKAAKDLLESDYPTPDRRN